MQYFYLILLVTQQSSIEYVLIDSDDDGDEGANLEKTNTEIKTEQSDMEGIQCNL